MGVSYRIAKIIIAVLLVLMVWMGYLGYALINLKPKIIAEWGYVDDKTTELRLHIYLGKGIPISVSIDSLTIEWAGIKIGRIENMKLGLHFEPPSCCVVDSEGFGDLTSLFFILSKGFRVE